LTSRTIVLKVTVGLLKVRVHAAENGNVPQEGRGKRKKRNWKRRKTTLGEVLWKK